MADYWKSQPRKFCQYCKCWIADNKPSVDFHERGKNHKENVSAKIEEIKKKSITKAKQEQKMSKQFAAMEEAALKAYEEDLKRLTSQSDESVSTSPALVKPQIKSTKREVKVKVKKSRNKPAKVWLEGRTDDGQIYYYNTVTGESQWEKPGMFRGDRTSGQTMQGTSGSVWMEARSPEGYTYYFNTETGESSWEKPDELKSLDGSSQAEIQGEVAPPQPESLTTDETASEPPEEPTDKTSESKEIKVPKINFRKRQADQCKTSGDDGGPKDCDGGREEVVKEADSCATESPAVKNKQVSVKNVRPLNPYGAWEQIQPPDDPYEKVDLQLPNAEPADVLLDVPSEPKSRFKERTITSLGDESNAGATFKKRKTENGKSRSLRQREEDF